MGCSSKRQKKESLLSMHFKKFWAVPKENQVKYGLIEVVNFITALLKNRWQWHKNVFNIQ